MDNKEISLDDYQNSPLSKSFHSHPLQVMEQKIRRNFSTGKIDRETFDKAMDELTLLKGGNKHDFSTKERESLSKKKEAMPDGSFPIRNGQDLKDAIKAFGRAKDKAATKAWIKKRAKELGMESSIPETWGEKVEKGDTEFDDEVEN